MANSSLIPFNSSLTPHQLQSNYSSLTIRKLFLPYPFITLSSPPSARRRRSHHRLIVSEMESSKAESAPQFHDEDIKSISSGDHNSLSPTIIASGQNLQLISLTNIPTWVKLALGSIVLLAIPFCRKGVRIKDVIKTVEEVAEVVEMAAEVTEKVAEGVAEALPDGSFLKEAAIRLEKIAFLVEKQAEITENFIAKVDDAVEVFDTALKPLIDGDGEAKISSDFNPKVEGPMIS